MDSLALEIDNLAYWERLATRETGRPAVAVRETAVGHLIVYPKRLSYGGLLGSGNSEAGAKPLYVDFPSAGDRLIKVLSALPGFLWRLSKALGACHYVSLYMLSAKKDWLCVFAAALISRLRGRSITLHDYTFEFREKSRRLYRIHSMCYHIVLGDSPAAVRCSIDLHRISSRYDSIDVDFYKQLRKKRAIPRVIVYGDLAEAKVLILVTKAHDLIKQKYPRAMFFLVSLTGDGCFETDRESITPTIVKDEPDLGRLYADSDILILLSPGGLNRLFGRRAALAGYPIVTNGFDYNSPEGDSDRISVIATRDSYSALADAVIKVVDNELYYQSFAPSG